MTEDETIRQRLVDLIRIARNAYKISDGDLASTIDWLTKPNRSHYNMTPIEMAFAGKGKRVYESQERWF